MKKLRIAACLLAMLAIAMSGCVGLSPFRVSGYIEGVGVKTIPESADLFADIGEAVRPFGFIGGQVAHENTFYYSIFSPERIDILVDPTDMWISVKDYNHFDETEFVRKILDAIEQRVMLKYGAKINFRRVADFLS